MILFLYIALMILFVSCNAVINESTESVQIESIHIDTISFEDTIIIADDTIHNIKKRISR